ncbi:MAG: hypothetical protein IJA85_05495 [Clostridia bacterium]|nr:hypothetical protein [Clostridia bacterium]
MMNNEVKKLPELDPKSYGPKKPEIIDLAKISDRFDAAEESGLSDNTTGGSGRIKHYRRIGNWENFFLDSAIYSVAQSLGIEYISGFTPISAITGDLFTYMYSDTLPCDSGITNYIVMPEVVLNVFDSLGYGCEYLSREEINIDLPRALKKIRASVDRGIPVLAWGVGGVVASSGTRYDPMPEGALIGGYEDDILFINLYPGAERLAETSHGGRPGVDEDGYTAIPAADALATTNGIFIALQQIKPTDPSVVYRDAIMSIPHWLTMKPTDGYVFGRVAFERWAEVLLNDENWQTPEMCAANMWDKHCCAFCSICTSVGVATGEGRAVDYLNEVLEVCPEFEIVNELLPHYRKMRQLSQQIWDTHGGFEAPADKMADHSYRAGLAGILAEMSMCCDEILKIFK